MNIYHMIKFCANQGTSKKLSTRPQFKISQKQLKYTRHPREGGDPKAVDSTIRDKNAPPQPASYNDLTLSSNDCFVTL